MSQRRHAVRLAYLNGLLWALGNGLASTTLVVYLALDLGAKGRDISLILAAPQLVGVLRWWVAPLIGRIVERKRFCLASYLGSVLLLLTLPILSAPGVLPSPRWSLAALVAIWCTYHLLEYLGTVALWSWLADMAPGRIRGRFLGRREAWMQAGRIVSMLLAGTFAYQWRAGHPDAARWIGYAVPAAVGALMMLVAIVPLGLAPALASESAAATGRWTAPVFDRRFRRLLLFGCWFSFFNGVTQSAQNIYPARVLGFALLSMLLLRTGMRLGQLASAPWFGRLADQVGYRPVMVAVQIAVATGPLFFLAATPESPWWMVGAFVVWSAYAGLNVCLPGLMLKLAPGTDNAPHIAFYYAVTGVFYAVSTVLGGVLFDALAAWGTVRLGSLELDHYDLLFLFGWIMRTAAVVLLLRIVEPGAWSWRDWLASRTVAAGEAVG